MSNLPIVNKPTPSKRQMSPGAIPAHICRIGLFIVILLLIRQKHNEFYLAKPNADRINRIEPDQLTSFIPEATVIHPWDPTSQSRTVVDATERPVSSLIQSSPASDSIVGYLGPTNLMVVLSPEQRIVHVQILESADTVEHVNEIRKSNRFLKSYIGLQWTWPNHWPEIDAVSGATLTSYAIMQSLSERAGGENRVLKFPDELTNSEIASCFADDPVANLVALRLFGDHFIQVMGGQKRGDRRWGYLTRTSPTADGLVGYQGPTDTLLILDWERKLTGLRVRSSFDNEPYVGYVKDDSYLAELLAGKTLAEIGSLPDEAYEGVSGATMTSLNVWDGVRLIANETSKRIDQLKTRSRAGSKFDFHWRDLGTGLICVFGIVMGLTQLRTHKRMRLGFLILVVVYLGFISGDMLSQAILVGWTQHGLPVSLAPGLVFLCLAALAVPIFSKHNVYCSHICPMGAIQQISKNRIGRKIYLSRWISRCLKLIPALLIVFVLLTAFKQLNLNLASLEAFDAFSIRVAGWITISVALVGLIASLFVPMAYCRFGCPTGAVLNFLRFNSKSGNLNGRDLLAIGALVLGLSV